MSWRSRSSKRRDPDSDEPVLRQLVDYADGTTLVLEQQNCLMHNLRVTLLSRESMPSETGLRRLGTVLGMTPVWKTLLRADTTLSPWRSASRNRRNSRR